MKKVLVLLLTSLVIPVCSVCAASAPADVRVAPLVTTEWGQTTVNGNACFNYYTPDSSGYPPVTAGSVNNYPSGCIATAMAQVVNYHQWALPQYPFGTTFTIYADGYSYSAGIMGGTLGGNYDWLLMQNISTHGLARQEAGRLLHDLGAALSMQYYSWSNWGSATDFDYIDNVFVGFTYSNAVTVEGNYISGGTLYPQSISTALAELAITTNLDAGLPVIIGINDLFLASGHALVIDGYGLDASGTTWFHWNFGLPVQGVTPPATNLGWFTLPGVGTTNDSAGYDVLDGIAFNIFKAVPMPATGEIISGRVTDTAGNPLSGIQVDITCPANPAFIPVTVFTNASGIYAAYGTIASNQQYAVTASGPGYIPANQMCSVGFSQKQWISLPNGDGYYINTVGNARVDMALGISVDIPSVPPISDLAEFSGFSQYWNTTHGLPTDPDIRYDYNGDWSVDFDDFGRLVAAWMAPLQFRTDFNVIFDTTGSLPADMPWQYAGIGGAWLVVDAPLFAAESPAIADGQYTSFKLPVKMLPGVPGMVDIRFHFSCDTEPMADVFEFLIDGVVQTETGGMSAFSGMTGPQMLNYQMMNVTAPQFMTLEWRYTKDSANSVGADKVWIGDITVFAHP